MTAPDGRRGAPDQEDAPVDCHPHQVGGTQSTAYEPDVLEVLAGVACWARPFLVGEAPSFGSAEWLALDPADRRFAAAVVRAALAWWRCGEPIEDVEERARVAQDVASSHAIAGALDWRDLAHRPTAAELARRRAWTAPPPLPVPTDPWPNDAPDERLGGAA